MITRKRVRETRPARFARKKRAAICVRWKFTIHDSRFTARCGAARRGSAMAHLQTQMFALVVNRQWNYWRIRDRTIRMYFVKLRLSLQLQAAREFDSLMAGLARARLFDRRISRGSRRGGLTVDGRFNKVSIRIFSLASPPCGRPHCRRVILSLLSLSAHIPCEMAPISINTGA